MRWAGEPKAGPALTTCTPSRTSCEAALSRRHPSLVAGCSGYCKGMSRGVKACGLFSGSWCRVGSTRPFCESTGAPTSSTFSSAAQGSGWSTVWLRPRRASPPTRRRCRTRSSSGTSQRRWQQRRRPIAPHFRRLCTATFLQWPVASWPTSSRWQLRGQVVARGRISCCFGRRRLPRRALCRPHCSQPRRLCSHCRRRRAR
mmetsp:Transcript_31211/g.103305  ORF Transcript_31211/g.103305 Transcript_31211/m.103305 type:complete len:201 (+) Transcript_31211:259-861(+)